MDGGFAGYGRKVIEELVKGLSAFQIIEQCLKRNPGPTEDGCASENVTVASDHAV